MNVNAYYMFPVIKFIILVSKTNTIRLEPSKWYVKFTLPTLVLSAESVAVYYTVQGGPKFSVCGRNPTLNE